MKRITFELEENGSFKVYFGLGEIISDYPPECGTYLECSRYNCTD